MKEIFVEPNDLIKKPMKSNIKWEYSEFNMMLDVTSFPVVQQLIQLMFRDCFSDFSVYFVLLKMFRTNNFCETFDCFALGACEMETSIWSSDLFWDLR